MIGTTEIIFIALIVLLLFGGKKIPELMRGVGKGMRSFKQGMNGEDDEQTDKQTTTDATAEISKEDIDTKQSV
ncbi:MAG: twin-arginine translocase TatA/TatE family subunit [Paludibacteraceae bacterium]|nr:twin-arginine translocase TatA/TatE family subunit [Paludibacteraceae bacterium]